MIRAILKNGVIEPLDPPPTTWRDGRELRVEEAESTAEDIDAWRDDLEAMVADLDPDDHELIEAALKQADIQAKAIVRREMGIG